MAERTGIAEIDLLLDDWQVNGLRVSVIQPAAAGVRFASETVPAGRLRDPKFAAHRCIIVSEQLVDFLRARGLDRPGREAYLSGDEWDGDQMVIERITPEHFGYQDRTVEGCGSHTVCMVDWDGERFMVDFTAAQYGYHEFPLVQRLVGDGCDWDREFVARSEAGRMAVVAG